MGKWLTKSLLPLLLLVFIAAYFEFGSVTKVKMDSDYGGAESEAQAPIVFYPTENAAKLKSRLAIGERYASLADLVTDQQAAGYLKIGTFGKNWPAKVAEIIKDNNSIAFAKSDGTRHNYTGFAGYRMKVVRLKAGERETIVVFRSEAKR